MNDNGRLECALAAYSRMNHLLLSMTDDSAPLPEICRALVAAGAYSAAWIGWVAHGKQGPLEVVASAVTENNLWRAEDGGMDHDSICRDIALRAIDDRSPCLERLPLPAAGSAVGKIALPSAVLALPLSSGSELLGALCLRAEGPHTFTDGEVAVLAALARDLAAAVFSLRARAERSGAAEIMARRRHLSSLFAAIATRFLHGLNFDSAVQTSLADIGHLCRADRAYLFLRRQDDADVMNNTHEWCAEGVSAQIDRLQNCPCDLFRWWLDRLYRGEIIHLPDVSALPADARAERELLESQHIRSLLVLPVTASGGLAGFIGFDNVRSAGPWDEHDFELLRIVASVIGSALERKLAGDTLEKLIHAWRGTCDALLDAIALLDGEGRVQRCNRAMALLLGLPFQDIIDRNCAELLHEHLGVSLLSQNGLLTSPTFFAMRGRWHEMRINPLAEVTGGVLIISDITERKRAEDGILSYQEQLRSLAAELALAEERVRRKIAIDMHEKLGQSLVLIKMHLEALHASPSFEPDMVNIIRGLAEEAISTIRTLTFDLFPPFLADLGLADGVRWLAETLSRHEAIDIHVHASPDELMVSDDMDFFLYRAIQELLLNVVKHARASQVTVTIGRNNEQVIIAVEDDGVGFDETFNEDSSVKTGRFGLFSIRERVARFGGRMDIRSRQRHGACVTLKVPLAGSASGVAIGVNLYGNPDIPGR